MEKGLKLSVKTDSKVINELAFMQPVDSLVYLTTTRLEMSYSLSYISIFMTAPKAKHWVAVKRVLRYVKGTLD